MRFIQIKLYVIQRRKNQSINDYSLFIEFVELKILQDYENTVLQSNDVVQYFTETFGEVDKATLNSHEVKKILNGEPLKLYINSFYGESGSLTLNDNSDI